MSAQSFTCSAAHSTEAGKSHYLTGQNQRAYTNNEGKPSMQFGLAVLAVVGLAFSPLPASAAITHTATNLNLRAGPGTHHRDHSGGSAD